MKVTVIIPARYASTRFSGKLLANFSGKPILQHVFERVSRATFIDEVFVATDDNRISEAVQGFKGKVIMTREDHPTGSDRIAEVAANLSSDIFINVQGDEPLVEPKLIDQVASVLISDKKIKMSSAATPFKSKEDFLNPNNVKVLCDQQGFALYFSRAPIPFSKEWEMADIEKSGVRKHVGIYGFQRDTLISYAKWKQTPLEKVERLEQLRALEHGVKVKIIETDYESVSIDTPEDLQTLSSRL